MNPIQAATGNPTGPHALPERRELANRAIRDYVIAASGTGFVPVPILDAVAIAALEVGLIGKLARIYDFPVPRKLVVYKILISLVASAGPVYFSARLLALAGSMTPISYAAHALLTGGSGAVSVYAVAKVFQKHYESGGTFLTADSLTLKHFFKERYAEGKRVVPEYLAGA
jgi:hypothetical protein